MAQEWQLPSREWKLPERQLERPFSASDWASSKAGRLWELANTPLVPSLRGPGYEEQREAWLEGGMRGPAPQYNIGREFGRALTTPLGIAGEITGAAAGIGLLRRFPNLTMFARKAPKISEVIPPESTALVTTRRTPRFIGGPSGNPLGQIASADVPPEIAAKIAGMDYSPQAMRAAVLNLDELEEAKRIAGLKYGKTQHEGLSTLDLADRPPVRIPTETGDTRFGFGAQTSKEMEYPYNVVPERLRPRAVQRTTVESLPSSQVERGAKPITVKAPEGVEQAAPRTEWKLPERKPPYYVGSNITPGEQILPSATKTLRAVGAPDGMVTGASRIDDVAKEVPELRESANQVSRTAAEWWMSGETALERMGKGGREVKLALNREVQLRRQLAAKWTTEWEDLLKPLSKEQQAELPYILDGVRPTTDPQLLAAANRARALTDEMGLSAVNAQVRFKNAAGKIEDFQPVQGSYWPHRYEPGTFDRQDFVERLVKSGMTRKAAQAKADALKKSGELFKSEQFARVQNLPEEFQHAQRYDLETMREHIENQAKLVSEATELGPGNLGIKDSIINQLIAASENPQLAQRITQTTLRGRQDVNPAFEKVIQRVREWQMGSKLSFQYISNLNANTATLLRSEGGTFQRALAEALTKEGQEFARASGASMDLGGHLLTEYQRGKFGKALARALGVTQAETRERVIASLTGRGTANYLFDLAKAGDERALVKLQDLILVRTEDLPNVLKQAKLTDQQLLNAGGRFAELTQGLAEGKNLPLLWSESALLQIPLIFKKFAFQGTRAIFEAIRTSPNPAKSIATLIAANQAMGEFTGDIKATITGTVRGAIEGDVGRGIEEKISRRGEFVGRTLGIENPIVARAIQNTIDGWMFGLFADIAMSSIEGQIGGFFLGPMMSDVESVGRDVGNVIRGRAPLSTSRLFLRSVPFVGRGLQEGLMPTQGQRYPRAQDSMPRINVPQVRLP